MHALEITFDSKVYKIEEKNSLTAIETVERFITLEDLCNFQAKPMRAALAKAFAALLICAGYKEMKHEELSEVVYKRIYSEGQWVATPLNIVGQLLALLIPPDAISEKSKELQELHEKAGGEAVEAETSTEYAATKKNE